MNVSVDSVFVDLEGIRLHAAIAGPKDGEVVILLHGFPEFWMSWRYQIMSLAKHGYRVIALDQRGYNLSDKPDKITDYLLDKIASDVILLDRKSVV